VNLLHLRGREGGNDTSLFTGVEGDFFFQLHDGEERRGEGKKSFSWSGDTAKKKNRPTLLISSRKKKEKRGRLLLFRYDAKDTGKRKSAAQVDLPSEKEGKKFW